MVARLTARRQGEKSKREKAVAGHRDVRKERESGVKRWVGEAGKRRRKQDQGRPSSGAGASVIIAVSRVLSLDRTVRELPLLPGLDLKCCSKLHAQPTNSCPREN